MSRTDKTGLAVAVIGEGLGAVGFITPVAGWLLVALGLLLLVSVRMEPTGRVAIFNGVRVRGKSAAIPRPGDPTLIVDALEVVNPTGTPLEVTVAGFWFRDGVEIAATEAGGRGEFRVEAHSIGPQPRVATMEFHMSPRDQRRHAVDFAWVQDSQRFLRVTDRLTGRALSTIRIADESWWRQLRRKHSRAFH